MQILKTPETKHIVLVCVSLFLEGNLLASDRTFVDLRFILHKTYSMKDF